MDEIDKPLMQKYRKTGDIGARNQIVEKYLPLVKRQASNLWKGSLYSVNFDDLFQWGVFGLIKGVDDYDLNHSSKAKLITYLTYKIRGAIHDGLRKFDPISKEVRRKQRNLENAVDQLMSELGRKPYEDEIRKKLKLSKKEFASVMKHIPYLYSLDIPCYLGGRDEKWSDFLASEEVRHDEVIEEKDFVKSVLKKLTENERLVLTLYYLEDFNFNEIAGVLGRSKQRAQQIRNLALETARESCS